jgi:hypothetical protein
MASPFLVVGIVGVDERRGVVGRNVGVRRRPQVVAAVRHAELVAVDAKHDWNGKIISIHKKIYFRGQPISFTIATNAISQCTQQHCYAFPKNLHPGGIRTDDIFLWWMQYHFATPGLD